jgi:flagellar motility protein MotE (MotC chaperone)
MVEEQRKAMRSNPKRETRTWLRKLEELDLKRRRAQDLAIQGLLEPDELRAKLAELKDTREMVERELEALEDRREQIEQLERNRDSIMETYASMASSALSALTPEERNQIYRVLRLRVSAEIGGTLEVSGELVTAPDVCSAERTYS